MRYLEYLDMDHLQFNNTSVEFYNRTSIAKEREYLEIEEFMDLVDVKKIILLIFGFLTKTNLNSKSIIKLRLKYLKRKFILRAVGMFILILTIPLVGLFLTLALIYKMLCSVIIKQKDKHFVKFLDSFDVFWCLEDDSAKNIINVVGMIESESCEILVESIKTKLRNIISNNSSDDTEKIFYRRSEEYGFYYWKKYTIIDMDQYVQIIDFSIKRSVIDKADMEEIMSNMSNKSLPYDNEGLFQIIVIKHKTCFNEKRKSDFGIIFRVHHSIGDGIALIEFLCNTLADEAKTVNMFSSPQPHKSDKTSVYDLLGMMKKLCEVPMCILNGVIREPDDNSLHGPPLTGKKHFKWTDLGKELLLMVREIKENMAGARFSDILAMVLSKALEDFFSSTMKRVPEDVAVVLPIRFYKTSTTEHGLRLINDFGVTILDLPINSTTKIQEKCNELRSSVDPLVNYYLLKITSGVLPKEILRPLLNSNQATMVFSNMPGPEILTICGGNLLKNLVFFLPHKGNTGLAVTALCYGGVLSFGAMVDEGLVSKPEPLNLILDGMVDQIKQLHSKHVKH